MFSTIILLTLSSAVLAEESKDIGLSYQFDYHSRWLSKGAYGYGKQGAVFNTLDVDLWGSGFGIKITHRNATASGYVDKQRIDWRPYFKGSLFEGNPYQTKFDISAGYEHYYGLARHKANTTWEWIFDFSWPNLLPCGVVPQYICHYETPVSGGDVNRKVAGWVHRFILGYDLDVADLPSPLRLTSEVAYTDGLGRANADWSYACFGISTNLKINKNLTFTPGIYQQISMEDSVNTDKDITYCIMSVKYKF